MALASSRRSRTPAFTRGVQRAFETVLATWIPPACPLTGERLARGGLLAPTMVDAIALDRGRSDDDNITAIFQYGGPIAELVRNAKFHPDESAARVLVKLWSKEAAQCVRAAAFDATGVAFVPAHWRRRAWRGFDLPQLLAAGLADALQIPVVDEVRCLRHQEPHSSGRSREDRAEASQGRFAVTQELRSERLILVDDVVTTGATRAEVRQAVEHAGHAVFALALARVDRLMAERLGAAD